MTSLAYIAFTAAACVLGLGLGLLIHFLRSKMRGTVTVTDDISALDLTGAVTSQKPWETITEWQRDSNRSFALHLITFAAIPAIASAIAWSSRSEVVHTICTNLQNVSVSSPLCF